MALGFGLGLGFSRGASFNPLNMPGLTGYYDVLNVVSADDTELTTWDDASDLSLDLSRSGGAGTGFTYKASGFYGIPELEMTGATSAMQNFTNSSYTSEVTFAAFYRDDATLFSDVNGILDFVSGSAQLERDGDGLIRYDDNAGGDVVEFEIPNYNKPVFVCVRIDSSNNATIDIDTNSFTILANTLWDSNQSVRLGYNGSGSDASRSYFAALVSEQFLSNGDVSKLRAYWRQTHLFSTYVITIAGQSNAEGRVGISNDLVPGSYTYNDLLYTLQDDLILKRAADPVDANITNANGNQFNELMNNSGVGFGGGMPCGDHLASLNGQRSTLMAVAKGGTRIAQWQRNDSDPTDDTTFYGVLLLKLRAAAEFGNNQVLIWYQGESDAVDATSQATFAASTQDFLNDIRSDLGFDIPIIITKLHRWNSAISATEGEWNAIQDAQDDIVAALDNCYLVDGSDLYGQGDDPIHLNVQSYKIIGQRWANSIFENILSGAAQTNPTPNFLDDFPNSSAAYSLRDLGYFDQGVGDVVRVYRTSDETEQSFTAAEVSNGDLLNYVVPASIQALYGQRMYWDLFAADDRVLIPIATNFFNGGNTISCKAFQGVAQTNRLFERDSASGAGQSFRALIGASVVDGKAVVAFRHVFSTSGEVIWTTDNECFVVGEENEISFTYDSSSVANDPVIVVNGVTQAITESTPPVGTANAGSGDLFLGNNEGGSGSSFGGSIYDVTVGTSFYEGYGNTDADWVDTVNSNDGTVAGSPALFTGQGFNGKVATWYDQSVSTASDAMYFDGVDDYVSLGNVLNMGISDYEVSGTFVCSNIQPTVLIGKKNALVSSTNKGFVVYIETGGTFRANLTDGTSRITAISSTVIEVGVEYDFRVVWDRDANLTIYLNGIEDGTPVDISSMSAVDITNSEPLKIGADFISTFQGFFGTIQNVNINNQASFVGNGNLDENWTDQIGSNNGTVNGSPRRVSTADYTTLANDAVQDTVDDMPTIVQDGVLSQDLLNDGTNDFLTLGYHLTELDDDSFTILGTAETTDVTTQQILFMQKSTPSLAADAGVSVYILNNGVLFFVIADGTTRAYLNSPTSSLVNNTSFHYAAVLNRGDDTMQLYINGALSDGTATDGPVSAVNSLANAIDATIGAAASGSLSLSGKENNVMIYPRALTADEVSEIYESTI